MEKAYKLSFEKVQNEGLAVANCGCSKTEALHSFGPALKPNYVIHFVLSGKGVFSVLSLKLTRIEIQIQRPRNQAVLRKPKHIVEHCRKSVDTSPVGGSCVLGKGRVGKPSVWRCTKGLAVFQMPGIALHTRDQKEPLLFKIGLVLLDDYITRRV